MNHSGCGYQLIPDSTFNIFTSFGLHALTIWENKLRKKLGGKIDTFFKHYYIRPYKQLKKIIISEEQLKESLVKLMRMKTGGKVKVLINGTTRKRFKICRR